MIDVVAGVAQVDGRYLVCRRPVHKHHGGLWEFPGGKCEEDEQPDKALTREFLEELELDVIDVGQPIFAASERDSPYLISFYPVVTAGEIELHEHMEHRWCSVEGLSGLSMAPVDSLFVQKLFSGEIT